MKPEVRVLFTVRHTAKQVYWCMSQNSSKQHNYKGQTGVKNYV